MIDRESKIDLLLLEPQGGKSYAWRLGDVYEWISSFELLGQKLKNWAVDSSSEYVLCWPGALSLPHLDTLTKLVASGVDIAHAGLRLGLGDLWPDLGLVMQDWSTLVNAPVESSSSNWRMSFQHCLVRRSLLLHLNGIDPAFVSLEAAGLDFGLRSLQAGALVEYCPELVVGQPEKISEPPLADFYSFLLRHMGEKWVRYVYFRRSLNIDFIAERRAWQQARAACQQFPQTMLVPLPYAFPPLSDAMAQVGVTAIVPTLGRYGYIPDALNSLRKQTVRPQQVIVVDQNPASQRKPQVYDGYDDLNLKVIWQDERGQSVARNTGVAAANQPYIFLFDDDSVAHPDLIESHLRALQDGRFHVSTGVSYPPPGEYKLPPSMRYPRISQTFDTGNCLLPRTLYLRLGGLDRNYDFGPGTDSDFGTRLYLAGCRILHNPSAIRIHYKAHMGGLRVHGVRKYNTDAGLLAPFPPVTRSYYFLRYLTPKLQREVIFLSFFTSKFSSDIRGSENIMRKIVSLVAWGTGLLLLPFKQYRSLLGAKKLLKRGPQLVDFDGDYA